MKMISLLSGGMDSTTAVYHAIESRMEVLACVAFDYGSKHNSIEHSHAERTCEKLGLPFHKINLDFSLFKSDLLTSGGDIPEGHYADESMKRTVVPFRNGIMLSYAIGMAESMGAKYVGIGNHCGDHAIYPDCRGSFVDAMRGAAKEGTYERVDILSPFCDISKTEIASIGDDLGVPWEDTYSCYNGRELHCGKCGTCTERIEAFTDAGIEDRTIYEGSNV
jgi:7-cyano-7-deazaguanine synthase